MKRLNLFKILSNAWPIILIFAVWFVFSSPYFLKQKVPFSSTYLVNFFSPWNAYPGFASPVKNNAMPDIISQIYPWKSFTIDSLKRLQIPLWNPYSFSGTPHLANYQSAVLSPFNLLFLILPLIDAWSLLILLQPLLAGIFMYLALRSFKLKKESSIIGSLAFMFCGFITTWMAYGTLAYSILFLPLAIFAIEKYYQTKKYKYLMLVSFSIPLSFFSGHFQISLYFLLFLILFSVYKLISTKNLRDFAWVIFYLFIGIFISLPQLLPSIELYAQSLRSSIFQKIEVIPWGYLPTFIAPDFLGNPVTRNDWFGHYAEWNAYLGLVPLMLAVYAVFRKRTKDIIFFALMAALTILLSLQTPLLDLLVFLKIPVLSTSAVSRIIVLFSFSMSVLAAFGFEKLYEDIKEKNRKYIYYWIGFFALLFALLWVIVLMKLFMPFDKAIIAKQNLLLPTLIFALTTFFIFVSFVNSLKLRKNITFYSILPFVLILIISFDMLRFANKWMPFDPRSLMYSNTPVVSEFAKISGYDRVVSNLGTEATIYYRLPSIEGYDAVYIKRYGEFIASLKDGNLQESPRSVVTFSKLGLYNKEAINLLGIKYIIHKTSDDHASWTFPFWTYKDNTFLKLYDDNVYQIFQNKDVLPRTFLVNKYFVEQNPQKILDKMFNSNLNLRDEVVLEQNPNFKLESVPGFAKISDYSPNKVVINTNSNGNSLLFISDTFYPGWEAFVDNNKTTIYRADYTFRAIYVPKGSHKIVFVYSPFSFKVGIILAVLALLLIPVAAIFRKKRVI